MRHVIRRLPVALVVIMLVMAMMPARMSSTLQRLSLFCGSAAKVGGAHGGVPVVLTSGQRAGPYAVSVWATPEVGTALLYVVLVPQRGVPFVAPRDVSINLRPASGVGPERRYYAYADPVRHGARFIAAVPLPRVDTWLAHVVIDGTAGPADLQVSFASVAPGSMGLAGMLLYAAPFILVAGLWGPVRLVRRRPAAIRDAALLPS